MSTPKHPEITVKLVGEDGNAFSILSRVKRALRSEGVSDAEVSEFLEEATAGDYDHLLRVVMNWVNVE